MQFSSFVGIIFSLKHDKLRTASFPNQVFMSAKNLYVGDFSLRFFYKWILNFQAWWN